MILFDCPHCNGPIESVDMFPGYERLTNTQQHIIDCLARRPGARYTLDQLAEYVWLGRDEPEGGYATLRAQICMIRKRLGKGIILNQHGVGYYLGKGNNNV